MKDFNEIIKESITLPQFIHPNLANPKDPEDKFWKVISACNDDSNEVTKQQLEKLIKQSKDLYASLTLLGDDYNESADHLTGLIKSLSTKHKDAISNNSSEKDLTVLKKMISCMGACDKCLSSHRWYNNTKASIKANYVPFRGSEKDNKIKYRMVYRRETPFTDSEITNIKKVRNINPLVQDYVAGVEFNKNKDAFQIMFTGTPGYKR